MTSTRCGDPTSLDTLTRSPSAPSVASANQQGVNDECVESVSGREGVNEPNSHDPAPVPLRRSARSTVHAPGFYRGMV